MKTCGRGYAYKRYPRLIAVCLMALLPVSLFAETPGSGLPVEALPVISDTLIRSVEAVGNLRDNESIVIRPEISGRLVAINFTEGEAVKQGDLLVRLDDSIYSAELQQAQARLALGRSNYERAKTLKKQGYGSDQELDQSASELQVRRAEVALAQARLEKTRIEAPFDGIIGLRQVSLGDYLQAGQEIAGLHDQRQLKVDFRLPESALPSVQVGQQIQLVLDALPGQSYVGEVVAIDPQVEINGRSLLLRAAIQNQQGDLRSGMFARVTLILSRQKDTLFVPESALVPQGDKQFVYRIDDGKAMWTEVTIGLRDGSRVELLGGLRSQDMVITAGHLKLQNGMAVMPLPQRGE